MQRNQKMILDFGINRYLAEIKIAFFVILCLSFIQVKAQDKGDIAKALFTRAENSYSSEKYEDALQYLNDCEKNLGSTNSRILYLKINVLNSLFIKSGTYLPDLKTAIDKFFEVTDKHIYPEEKYSDIVNIKIDIDAKKDIERTIYTKLKSSTDRKEFEEFFQKYPTSKYEAELKLIYNKLPLDVQIQFIHAPCGKFYKVAMGLAVFACPKIDDIIVEKQIHYPVTNDIGFFITVNPKISVLACDLYVEKDGNPYNGGIKLYNKALKRNDMELKWGTDKNGNFTFMAPVTLTSGGTSNKKTYPGKWKVELHDASGKVLGSNTITILQ